jgi:hypothetical protein
MYGKIFDDTGAIRAEVLNISETNGFADPATANNGGGYSQPKIVVRWDCWRIEITDLSCGDFGSRYTARAQDLRTVETQSAYWGSMYRADEISSDFTAAHKAMLDDVYRLTGYHIPTRDEI